MFFVLRILVGPNRLEFNQTCSLKLFQVFKKFEERGRSAGKKTQVITFLFKKKGEKWISLVRKM